MGSKNNEPSIRFIGFNDNWEQRKLSSLSRNIGTGKSKYNISQFYKYAILGSRGVIGYDNKYDYSGDFILTARVGEYAGELYRYNGNVKITDNTVYIQGDNLDYLYYLLKQYDLKKLSFGSGQPLVKASELSNLELKATSDSNEKRKISALFSEIDNLITLHQGKLDNLEILKKTFLKKIFPTNNNFFPGYRFKEFNDAWEQRKLSELFFRGGSGGTPRSTNKSYYNGKIPFLGISDISNSNGFIDKTEKYITEEGLNNSSAWIVPSGSISLAMYASVGKLAILNTDVATSQAFYNMVFDDESLRDYVYQRLGKANEFGEWTKLISTGTQANLNAEKVKNFKISLPTNKAEISMISNFFMDLDNLITLHQRKFEHLENLKKYFLNNMFI